MWSYLENYTLMWGFVWGMVGSVARQVSGSRVRQNLLFYVESLDLTPVFGNFT